MVVSPEPAVMRRRALGRGAVDRAVGPGAEHRADEALGLAVCLRPVGPRAQMLQAEDAAGEGVDGRAIGTSVIRQHALDSDAVAAEEANGAAEEGDRGLRLLVAEYLDVGHPRGVVDTDVDVFPAHLLVVAAGRVALARVALQAAVAVDAVACAAVRDSPELLDVDVDQLAGALALVALGRLEPDPPQA